MQRIYAVVANRVFTKKTRVCLPLLLLQSSGFDGQSGKFEIKYKETGGAEGKEYPEITIIKELVKKGRITISEAAHNAKITIWEMEKYLIEQGYTSHYSTEDFKREYSKDITL